MSLRNGVHDGHLEHQVRPRRDPRGRARHEPVGGAPGHGRDRPLPGRDASRCSRVLEALRRRGIEAVLFDQVRVEPTDESIPGGHRLRRRGAIRRLCRRRRRLEHRHGQGGQPVRDLSRGVARPMSIHRSGKGRPVPGQAEAADRGADHGRDGERDDRAWRSSTTPRCTPRRASRTARSARCWA